MVSVTQRGASFIPNTAVHRLEGGTGPAALPFSAQRSLEKLTIPARAKRSASIQDTTAMDSMQLLSHGDNEQGGRMLPGCLEDQGLEGPRGVLQAGQPPTGQPPSSSSSAKKRAFASCGSPPPNTTTC